MASATHSAVLPKSLGSQLRRNAAAGAIYSISSAALLGITYPLYLHFLGLSQYGLWLVLSTVLAFAQLGNLGMGQAVSKQVAAEVGKGSASGIIVCVSTALCTLLASGAVVCGCLIYFRFGIARQFHLSRDEAKLVSDLLPVIGLLSLYAIFLDTLGSTLAGLGRIDLYSYLQLLNQFVSVGGTVACLMLGKSIASFVVGSAVGYLGMHLGIHLSIRRVVGCNAFQPSRFSMSQLRQTLSLSVYLMGSSAISLLLTPLNRILLARYVGLASVPAYDIIYSGCMKTRSLLDTAVRALMPEVSRISSGDSRNAQRRIIDLNRKMMLLIVLAGGPVYLVLFVFGGPLLHIWLGERAAAVPLIGLRICLIGTFSSLASVPAFYTLLGLGKGRSLLGANILQSSIPVAAVLGALLLSRQISLVLILAGVATGMVFAGGYLIWKKTRTLNTMFVRAL